MNCSQNLCENYSKLAINWKNINDLIISWHQVIVKIFCRCFVSLVKFSYWSTFHVNIINGSGVMTIFFYKWLAINSEIENTPVFFPLSGNLHNLGIPNLAEMSPMKCYWMLENARITVFTVSELLREKQQGW